MTKVRLLLVLGLGALGLLSLPPGVAAEPVTVKDLRMWQAPDNLRLVFDVSRPPEYRVFSLDDPQRIVIDIDDARLDEDLPAVDAGDRVLATIRAARNANGRLRVVLDLKTDVQPRSFVLAPYGQYGHRLVLDLYDRDNHGEAHPAVSAPSSAERRRDLVIAIDAGHGGDDPGAIGRRHRTREKDVVLAIARELARGVDRTPGMQAVLIRDGDYFIGLKARYDKARRYRADMFVSIHADAVPGRRARGSSVYALSERGASSALAKFLADSENSSDLIGGVSLDDKDPLLQKVLVDLSQTHSISTSLDLGASVLRELKRIGPLHLGSVGQAGFAVLKAPDIPSILVETAFISNPSEEKKLRSRGFQRQVAGAILDGIKNFINRSHFTPRGTVVARPADNAAGPRQHIVRRGETLTAIASRYNTSVDALRFANNISGSKLMVGEKLLIP